MTKRKAGLKALLFCKQILGEPVLFEEGLGFFRFFYEKGVVAIVLYFSGAFGFGGFFIGLFFFQFREHFVSL
jgi:hypothetical protein